MKLATYQTGAEPRLGLVLEQAGSILDLQAAHLARQGSETPSLASMLALIEAGPAGLDLVSDLASRAESDERVVVPLASATLMAPLPLPPQIRDFSVFEVHLLNSPVGLKKVAARVAGEPEPAPGPKSFAQTYRDFPIFYFSNRFNVAGPGATIPWPPGCAFLDFELEIGGIIGRTGKDIRHEAALDHLFGYTIFNDVSARDIQSQQMAGDSGRAKARATTDATFSGHGSSRRMKYRTRGAYAPGCASMVRFGPSRPLPACCTGSRI